MKIICVRIFAAAALLLAPLVAHAQPTGGIVAGGAANATIGTAGSVTTVNQFADRAIIDWSTFNIGAGHTALFKFLGSAGANSAVLNRVDAAGGLSQIYGTLRSELGNGSVGGTVYLINPSGIVVGPGGVINVGSFVGSTFDLGLDRLSANANFLNASTLTLSGNSLSGIDNQGTISALGDVFLIAHTVRNSGNISGDNVGLVAANVVELRPANIVASGGERISVIAGQSTEDSYDGVINSGTISAVTAELKAAGGNIYALAINNGGVVRAQTVVRDGGRIFLSSSGGTVINTGTLDASGTAPGATGGHVQVTGGQVGLAGNALVTVSGDAGGGTIYIGGGFQGANPDVENARATFVGSEVRLLADALTSGNGGTVIVWSDEVTRFYGHISAQGANGGDGGFAEISSHNVLIFDGTADVTSSATLRGSINSGSDVAPGRSGTVLLDPLHVIIADAGPDDANVMTSPQSPEGVLFSVPDTTSTITISDEAIEALTGSFEIQARDSITINQSLVLGNLGTGETGTFRAGGDITVSPGVSITTAAGGNLSFIASDVGGIDSPTATITINDADIGAANTFSVSFLNSGSGGVVIATGGTPTVNASATISFNSPLTINQNTTFGSGSTTVSFTSVTGMSSPSLNVSGNASFIGDAITPFVVTGLSTLTVSGGTTFGQGSITSTGTQTFTGASSLTGNVTINAGAGNVNFTGAISDDGTGRSLTISGTAGTTTFGSTVGAGGARLSTLSVSGPVSIANNIFTTGNQTYTGAATITGDANLDSSTGTVTFSNTVNGTTDGGQSLTVTGNGSFASTVGAGMALEFLTVTGAASIANNITTSTTGGGTANQTFQGAVTLAGNAMLTSTGGGAINFQSTVNGAFNLTVNTTGATTFGGSVGGNAPLTTITTDAGGTVTFGSSAPVTVATTGNQTYNEAATLAQNTTITAGTGTVSFVSTIAGGANNLSIAADGIDFADAVNGTGAITLQGGAAGTTVGVFGAAGTLLLTTAEIAFIADQHSSITIGRTDGTAAVTVAAGTFTDPVVIRADGMGGSVVTTDTITGTGEASVTLNTTGATSGTISLGGNITVALTAGTGITLNGNVTLTANSVLTTGNANIVVNNNIAGDFNLTFTDGGGNTTVQGTIGEGAGTQLNTLAFTGGGGTTTLNGGSVRTDSNQTYNDNVVIGADTTFT
ncbi:MAG: filamentous hemagglutinin N-terminal domain-containing protein, partial [Verrucomicrobia bacterium]|nr:filamentous hemagglutinin N-terminal domain-containing protein [Verrucomicrobiota bacterium]